jgi:hypothetical protein
MSHVICKYRSEVLITLTHPHQERAKRKREERK